MSKYLQIQYISVCIHPTQAAIPTVRKVAKKIRIFN